MSFELTSQPAAETGGDMILCFTDSPLFQAWMRLPRAALRTSIILSSSSAPASWSRCVKCDYAHVPMRERPAGDVRAASCLAFMRMKWTWSRRTDTAPTPPADRQSQQCPQPGNRQTGRRASWLRVGRAKSARRHAGIVWRARERLLERHVAIKLLRNVNNDHVRRALHARSPGHGTAELTQRGHALHFGRTRSNHCSGWP